MMLRDFVVIWLATIFYKITGAMPLVSWWVVMSPWLALASVSLIVGVIALLWWCGMVALKLLTLQLQVHQIAKSKGWWDKERSDGELIALMHSELSEALEALREGNPPDSKIPEFSGVEAELADVIIRIMDYAEAAGFNVAGAIVAKAEMNKSREHMHGGKLF